MRDCNKSDDALDTLEKAREKFSQNFTLELCLGLAYGNKKDYKQAAKHYTAAEFRAAASDPSHLDNKFRFHLGAAYERLGNYPHPKNTSTSALGQLENFKIPSATCGLNTTKNWMSDGP